MYTICERIKTFYFFLSGLCIEHCLLEIMLTFIAFCFTFVQLGDLVQLVRGRLSKIQRAVLSALIVIEVHAKDVAAKLVEQEVSSVNDFEWISQLRFVLFLNAFLFGSSVTLNLGVHCIVLF